jgi:hypothetical protein
MHSQFELNPEVSEIDFLTASDKMQAEFYDQYDSFKRRELLKQNETWIEIQYWSDNGPEKHIQKAFRASETCMAFMGMIKMDSIKAFHLNQVRIHDGTN